MKIKMKPQQQVVLNIASSQQPVAVENTDGLSEEALKMRKKTIFSLGKAELAIGCVMVLLGIFITIYTSTWKPSSSFLNNPFYYHISTYGEGIWCGIWVIIAGGLGMGAGGSNSTPCLINTHMGFSIIGSLMSASVCLIAVNWANVGKGVAFYCALISTFSVISFAAAIILIVSASYCCCAIPYSCCGRCCHQKVHHNMQIQQLDTFVNAPQVQGQGTEETIRTNHTQDQVSSLQNSAATTSTNVPEKNDTIPL